MYENELHIPKGTTCKIYVSIDENGEPYEPETGDVVRFGVKLDPLTLPACRWMSIR